MNIRLVYIVCILFLFKAYAQPIEIPSSIYFAGIQLNLSQDLRYEIQKQVIALLKNKTYHENKIKLTDTYFPFINRAFEQENIHTDFKYLVIQESGMQSDAVSSSNAVGFWQFKKESAQEVGLIVNNDIDERKHIIASSHGAARYLKKNYLLTTNWLYALIAYNTGLGGVKQFMKPEHSGATEMNLDINTHWYAVKFLAHKLAYEDKVGYNPNPDLTLLEYEVDTKGKSLSEISKETKINEDNLKLYNKWLGNQRVPGDKNHTVLLPVTYLERDQVAASLGISLTKSKLAPMIEPTESTLITNANNQTYVTTTSSVPLLLTYNNLNAIQARQNDTPAKLAFAGSISPDKFFKYNDLQKFEEVKAGKIYYLEEKNNKAILLTHIVKSGESLWDISQKYGIKIKQLVKKNRLEDNEALMDGRILYLKQKRASDEPIQFVKKEISKPAEQPKMQIIDTPKVEKKIILEELKIVQVEKTQPSTDLYLPLKDTIPLLTVKVSKPLLFKDIIKDSALVYHIVGAQQTLFSIARHYHTKTDSIRVWNYIGVEGLKFDQKIVVQKNGNSLKNKYKVWVVKQTTTIEELALELNLPVEKIAIWNDKKSGFVMLGEFIKVK